METGNSDFCTSSISDSERAWSQFVEEHNASLLAKGKFCLNPDSLGYSKFLKICKPAVIFVENFCDRYESGKLGGEGQGILCDALLSINDWMIRNGNSTQLYFVVRDAVTTTSSGKFFEDGKEIHHTIHFTMGEEVLVQVSNPEPGTAYYVLHLDMWALSMTLPHASGIPVIEYRCAADKAFTFSSFSSVHNIWPKVLIGTDCCVAQLLGLTQFGVVPRHPQHPQSHTKWINWGVVNGIFRTTAHHRSSM
jgi:hypothetical protein